MKRIAVLFAAGLALASCTDIQVQDSSNSLLGYWVADPADPGYAGLIRAQVPTVLSIARGSAANTVELHSCQNNNDPGYDVILPLKADGSAEGGIRGERLWVRLAVTEGRLTASGKSVKAGYIRGSRDDFTC